MIKTLRLSLLLTILAVTAYYGVLHVRLLRISHPITQDEPANVELATAGNPYTAAGVLAAANVYGPGYPLWSRPFRAVFADPYIAHRWASSVALFAALGVLAWTLRRSGVGGIETVAGLALCYILNVSSHSLAATPDLLGLALYLAALAASERGRWPGLLAGLALLVAAALTKPYFALGGFIVVAHLALFAAPRRALAYLLVGAGAGAAVAIALQAYAPYYFLTTFGVHQGAAVRNVHFLLGQTREFAVLACGLVLLALAAKPIRRRLEFGWTTPLLQPGLDLWSSAAVIATAVLLGSLGWHPGNYLVYFFHLLLGPLVIVALRRLPAWPRLGRIALAVNLLVLGYLIPPQPGSDHWADLEANVSAVQGPILADPLLEPFTRSRSNVELFTHGMTPSVLQALDRLGDAAPPSARALHAQLLAQAERTNARIRAQEFAAIYLCYQELSQGDAWSYEQRHVLKDLFAHYRAVGEVRVYPYATPYWDRLRHGEHAYHVTQWVPKK